MLIRMPLKQYTSKPYTKTNFKFNPYSDCGNPKLEKINSRRYNRHIQSIDLELELLLCNCCKAEILDKDKLHITELGFSLCEVCWKKGMR